MIVAAQTHTHSRVAVVASLSERVGSWTMGADKQRDCTLTPGVAAFLCVDAAQRTEGVRCGGEK